MFRAFRRPPTTTKKLVSRNGQSNAAIETLEARQLMALVGVTLTDLPIEFYNSTGQMQYDTATGAFDVSATPTAIFLPTGPRAITATHGDFQIHARVSNTGALLGGVNFGDLVNLGDVNAAGDDFVMRGAVDLDGNGSIDPITETGDLLRGEIFAFGFQDSGGPTDQYDYKFVLTGGLLASQFAGRDIGVTMTSENSGFEGSFGVNYTGQAKGSVGPIASPLVSSIGGFVYYDQNNDGIFQGTESPIPGTLVTLTGINDAGIAVLQSMNTLADGSYLFSGLRPGTYRLTETQPATYLDGKDTIGTPGGSTANDQFSDIVLPANYNGVNNNFGEILASSIGGYVYYDLNNDGTFQGTESPIPGTRITLTGTDDLGNAVNMSMNTLANGSYLFSGLRPGIYQIDETQPATYLDGIDTIGTPGGTTTNDRFSNINLPAGFNGVNNNFGEIRVGNINGKKWLDITGNGLTSDDTGFGGVTIYIDANNNGTRDSGERSTVTASDGTYSFSNLNAGSYIIREVVPANYVRTAPTLTDRYVVTLGTGQTVTNIDFANTRACDCYTLTSFNFLINGTTVVSDLRGNTNQGDEVTVIFTVPAGQSPYTFSLVSYTAPENYFDANTASQQRIYDLATGVFGPGTHTMTVILPDCNYQVDFVCGSAIDRLGPAGSNIFYSAQRRLLSADNDGNCDPLANPAEIRGQVYVDRDNDGVIDSNETGIANVTLRLTGTDNLGQSVSLYTKSYSDGTYVFGNLRPGTYKVTETQPSNYNDGKETVGTLGGNKATNDQLAAITIASNQLGVNYNFGEQACISSNLDGGTTASLGFWLAEGRKLLTSLNGSANDTDLGNWMASNFPRMFGSSAGSAFNLTGKTNTQVADAFLKRMDQYSERLDAQIMATAFSVFVTSTNLAGGNYAAYYGFSVSSSGVGGRSINLGSAGSELGLSDGASTSILDMLRRADARASGGKLFASNASSFGVTYNLFDSFNRSGLIH